MYEWAVSLKAAPHGKAGGTYGDEVGRLGLLQFHSQPVKVLVASSDAVLRQVKLYPCRLKEKTKYQQFWPKWPRNMNIFTIICTQKRRLAHARAIFPTFWPRALIRLRHLSVVSASRQLAADANYHHDTREKLQAVFAPNLYLTFNNKTV